MLTYITPIAGNLVLWLWVVLLLAMLRGTRGQPPRRRWGLTLLVAGWLMACPAVAGWLAWPLEGWFERPSVEALRANGVHQVVVLTGGGLKSPPDHLAGALPDASAHRFLAGLELCRRLGPDCRLIFSGSAGRGRGEVATADAMARLARLMAPAQTVVSESISLSTAEHPANVGPLLEDGHFALVTSAYHQPRALRSFRRAGYRPTPFPVETLAVDAGHWTAWLPSSQGLATLSSIWREALALGLYAVRGW